MKILCITPIPQDAASILERLGKVTHNPNATYDEVSSLLSQSYDVVYLAPNKQGFYFDKNLLCLSPLKIVVTVSTGVDHIDIPYCNENNIQVLSLFKDYECINEISSTAEHAFALMLSLIRNIPASFDSVKRGKWDCELFIGRQLKNLSVGVVGYGRLGKMFASYCSAFGMNILTYDPYVNSPGACANLPALFHQSDVVSLHTTLTRETENIVNLSVLENGNDVYLVNTSRGQVVNERDVIEALRCGYLNGYATDVVCNELTDVKRSPLVEMSQSMNIIITPHIGGVSREAQLTAHLRMSNRLEEQLNEKCSCCY